MDSSSANSAAAASMNAMNILQQFSQFLFLQSLAAGQNPMMNPASMFGLPQTPQQQASLDQTFSSQAPTPASLASTSPGNVTTKFQTIADILASHQNLKTELSSTPSSSSSAEYSSPFKMYGSNNVVPARRYKVSVNRESAKPLQQWMNQHITDPYPSQRDVHELSKQTGFTFKQIRNWFTNSRRRYEQQCYAHSLPLPWIKKDAPKVCRKTETSSEESC
uniref:Homeobox domain-containing protein n=1 Tax=Panagrolaimus davidi TaxID=227884 RepID=A0A914QX31_9BILA